jgi:uncharacterized protein (UPF0332 family)
MNGSDFLHLAIQLGQSNDEARLRTAVSRAYYGVFHLAKDLLAEFGVQFPATEKQHSKLPHCLINSGCSSAEVA